MITEIFNQFCNFVPNFCNLIGVKIPTSNKSKLFKVDFQILFGFLLFSLTVRVLKIFDEKEIKLEIFKSENYRRVDKAELNRIQLFFFTNFQN